MAETPPPAVRSREQSMAGPAMFMRFGYPPNALGYCGPADVQEIGEMVAGRAEALSELQHLVTAFLGAWPYLELIGHQAGLAPLDRRVVEAYWLGNGLLDSVDPLSWGNSLDERFRIRSGSNWEAVVDALLAGGVPNHAFHVFCVYPWVGLLRSGVVDHALEVLDRCRIRWGTVVHADDAGVLVDSQPLGWDGTALFLAPSRVERVDASIDPGVAGTAGPGDVVALHWNYVCQKLTDGQLRSLRQNHDRHLAIVNGSGVRIAGRIGR